MTGANASARGAGAIARLVSIAMLIGACAATMARAQDAAVGKPIGSSTDASVATASVPEAEAIPPSGQPRDAADSDHLSPPSNPGGAPSTADSHGFDAPFSSRKGPINIKSDSMSLDYKGKIITWTGNVHAVQSGTDLVCDIMHVYYGVDFNDIKSVVADHNVKITQGGRWVTSDHAVLDQTARTITMTGNPVIHDGPDQITGTKVLVYLDSQKSVVEGGARAVIFPHKDKTRDNQAGESEDRATGQHTADQRAADQKQ